MIKFVTSMLLLGLTVAACSQPPEGGVRKHRHLIPDIPPDATSAQLRAELAKQEVAEEQLELDLWQRGQASSLDAAIKMGERNLDWLKHINSKLPADQALSFSSKKTMSGYPIDKPNRYSKKIALDRYNEAITKMPEELYRVLIKGEPFTDTPPVKTKIYLEWGLKLDKVYQTAARWKMMQPYLFHLAQRRQQDIRGFYFLNIEVDLERKLRNFNSQTADEQKRLEQWLVLLCLNTEGVALTCQEKLELAKTSRKVWVFYKKYNPRAKKIFDGYFKITSKRNDITWNDNVLVYPFRDPKNGPVETYLKVNIEDEWKWNGWQLVLNFTPNAATHVEFVPGTTPHVNGLAGSKITMDANAPLTEWDVQWTIRHEFGHSLGLPDCYIEFYEEEKKEIVNYQIDTSNLMCSRMGKLQQKHYDELKRAYSK